MRIRCSYCREYYGEKEPLTDDSTTHGICPECYAYYALQWRGQSLSEFLDGFEFPILALDASERIIAANRRMADLLHRAPEQMRGLRAGEAAECVYARRPEGCGQSVHCLRCTLRLNVTDTFKTGREHRRVPASLELNRGQANFLVSTRKVGEAVYVLVDEPPDLPQADQPALSGNVLGRRPKPI